MKRCIAVLFLCVPLAAQVAEKANSGYRTKEGREGVAKNLSASDRDARQRPKELVAALELKPGMTVVDLGTGVGYMLPYLSNAVGERGRVIAQDIFEDFIEKARATAAREKLSNVSYVLGTTNDPRLLNNTADLILTLDAYHHFDYPEQMLAGMRQALRPEGRLAIVDFYRRPGAMGGNRDPRDHIRLDIDDVIKEVEANGFKLLSRGEHNPGSQYLVIFSKK